MTRIPTFLLALFALTCAPVEAADAAGVGTETRNVPAAGTYIGYTGTPWARDYGVTMGKCDRAAVALALNDPANAASDQATVALLAGPAINDVDRSCAAQVLELARSHRTVTWKGSGQRFAVTPLQDAVSKGLPCRRFVLRVTGERARTVRALACQTQPGIWQLAEH